MLSPNQCVVLVPVGGSIVPECEDALRELERRGYTVRRVRGYSAIDMARCQMATDALRDGFEELFWIDSDIVFHPNDVDRLRRHGQPFVCGLYPKKSRREFACNYLPGTERLLFGADGGLHEILYCGFGFNYTHRSLYDAIRRELRLPICNERFSHTLVPFFMPLVVEDTDGPWYLGEDYAFCERARRCGARIWADTSVRLFHVGTYKFAWEDAGADPKRFASYAFLTGVDWAAPERRRQHTNLGWTSPAWQLLKDKNPWPSQRPDVIPNLQHGWLREPVRQLLVETIPNETRLVIELGAWLGLSTRFLLDRAPNAAVISIDHWAGSPEHRSNPSLARMLPTLYETFLANCWHYRNRLLPLRMSTTDGLDRVLHAGLEPNMVFIDADHTYEAVYRDLEKHSIAFPTLR